ncbi:pirin family protein [Actinoplanes sp. NPDC049596]|uniref:pirin family protein n=1 Tax=unclassified Actinoplanes TaxID=2626549 RepID=UPI0034401327
MSELIEGAPVALGGPRGFAVTRLLPSKQRRMVGAWCFLDAYGPEDLHGSAGMRVGPHPHTGLQTVTWLLAGEVLHRDTLGSVQEIRPGQLNLMTAGRGIAHSEETPAEHSPILHGVQLWVALPHAVRDMAPAFAHHADLPVVTVDGLTATVLMGTLLGATSPAACHTPLVGAELALAAGAEVDLPVEEGFEHALLTLDGAPTVDGTTLKPGPLLYAGEGRRHLRLATAEPARLLLLGGEPFEERLVMWWNFVKHIPQTWPCGGTARSPRVAQGRTRVGSGGFGLAG